jgi:pimeloyl-ACP methyl ester carboxylesterase
MHTAALLCSSHGFPERSAGTLAAGTTGMRMLKLAILTLVVAIVPGIAYSQGARGGPTEAAATTKPVIVLVHGAWADGSSWDKVMPLLQAKGYNVVAVHLPMTSTADDVAATTRAIEQQSGDVVLVAHSYGGNVISQAGNNPKVKALVYVAAFGLDDGESINGIGKNQAPPAWSKIIKPDSGGFLWLPADGIAKYFAPDLPAADQRLIAAKQAPFQSKDLDEPMKSPAWKAKPNWYVVAKNDQMIDPKAEQMFAKRMNAKTTTVDSSHVAMLAKPRQVAAVILDAATAPTTTAQK